MDAAENLAALLHPVPDDPAMAMRTDRRERVDRALETVEGVMLSGYDHFEGLVVFVFANFTCSHTATLSRAAGVVAVSDLLSPE